MMKIKCLKRVMKYEIISLRLPYSLTIQQLSANKIIERSMQEIIVIANQLSDDEAADLYQKPAVKP